MAACCSSSVAPKPCDRIADNLPAPEKVVELLKSQGINRVKLYDTDKSVLYRTCQLRNQSRCLSSQRISRFRRTRSELHRRLGSAKHKEIHAGDGKGEDLWKVAFPVGIEWEKLDAFYESNWEFKNLEEALEEGGMLHGKKVFVFLTAESQWLTYKDVVKVANIPTIVVADSPFPPSDKIAVASILFATEEIIPMKQMKMDWVPYIPFEKRDRRVDRINSQIFILSCTQRRSALKHLKEDRAMKFSFCLPYFYNPFEEDVLEQSTEVKIAFPSEMPVICQFDWELDEVEEFVDDLIAAEELPAEEKDEFKEFLKEKVRAAKKANREAREARRKAIEEMSEDTKEAFQSIKFYKFYPQSPPDVSGIQKTRFISRCHRKAHQVL